MHGTRVVNVKEICFYWIRFAVAATLHIVNTVEAFKKLDVPAITASAAAEIWYGNTYGRFTNVTTASNFSFLISN